MPLPPPDTVREPLHTRSIRVQAFARDDGQWDLDAELIDIKAYDFPESDGTVHRAGEPVHHMHLRVTFDESYTITAAVAAYDAAPYGPYCTAIAPDYGDLVGMNLLRKFRDAVKARFGRVAGCTHLSELTYVLPTVAIQSMAQKRRLQAEKPAQPGAKRPFQLDGCHALRVDGPVAKEFYPQWYVSPRQARRE